MYIYLYILKYVIAMSIQVFGITKKGIVSDL